MANDSIFDLSGKVALVTGASQGLGRAFSEIMAKYGADVACTARNIEGLNETVRIISKYGRKAIAIKTDVTNAEDVRKMADETVKQLGRIDILIANAGITGPPHRIHDLPIDEWDKIVSTNLRGEFLCMRAVIPFMLEQKSGNIITVSSIGGFAGNDVASPAYGASKAGIFQLTRYAAKQYGKQGIRVNCIAPGLHETGLGAPQTDEEKKKREQAMAALFAHLPLARAADPMELEGLTILLASNASSYITGAVFTQDGGHMAVM